MLYADITLLVSNASSANYKNFMVKRNNVLAKLKSPFIPKNLLWQATLYLDYIYEVQEDVSAEEVLKELPEKLSSDFLLEKYNTIVQSCVLFRGPISAEINKDLASDLLKSLDTTIYLSETYILKVGQVVNFAIFLLEGNLNVKTIRKFELLGAFKPGDFYSTDLDPNIDDPEFE